MENFVLSCCSTADLSKEHFEKISVKYVCFHYEMDGVQYEDDLGHSIPFEEFYKRMEEGAETKTSQVNAEDGLDYSPKCFISQSACMEDAEAVARLVEEKFHNLNGKVEINYVGTTIGSHTGPGTVALFFYGGKRVD